MIPDSVTRYPIVNAIADPNHTPTTSWLARESGSGNQSPTGILTTSGVSSVSSGHYTRAGAIRTLESLARVSRRERRAAGCPVHQDRF